VALKSTLVDLLADFADFDRITDNKKLHSLHNDITEFDWKIICMFSLENLIDEIAVPRNNQNF
jgi:hypothetical protein